MLTKLALLIGTLATLGVSSPAHAQATSTTIRMRWTVPGDDSLTGRAASYDLRYSTSPITVANFAAAARFNATPAPGLPGATDSVTVTGLTPATTYFFALKTLDEVPNASGISNVISMATLPAPDTVRPGPILDLRFGWYDAAGRRVRVPGEPGIYFAVDSLGDRRLVVITRQGAFPGSA